MHRTAVWSILLAAALLTVSPACGAKPPAAVKSSAAAKSPAPAAVPEPAWVVRSNKYTQMLLDVQMEHSPESASAQGLAQYDASITDASRADEIAQRKQLQEVLDRLKKIESKQKDRKVRQDLEILQRAYSLQFRRDDYQFDHNVQFIDAAQTVFNGLQTLLNDRVAPSRRPEALVRLRKYAGVDPGFTPFSEVLKQRMIEQMAKPGIVYPLADQMETELARDRSYADGIAELFTRYKITGWQAPYAKLRQQLAAYDTWIRADVMPKARSGFSMTPAEYALTLESYGVDTPPDQLAALAHADFTQCQAQMAPIAAQLAKQNGWASTDYRDVIRQLKKKQITGDAILPFYKARLKAIEDIIVAKDLVTLPDHPVVFRLETVAESARQHAPHMLPPPFLHNTGQTGEFLLPLNAPSTTGDTADNYGDFTSDAVAWPLVAHEARPGMGLEFDAMLRNGVSDARMLYAYNATNVDSWGLYSEWLMQPYEPLDGQLMSLDLRLQRDARAFLDPELQVGKVTPQDAYKLLVNDVVLNPVNARAEIERFTRIEPGQSTSYFYGFIQLLQLRKDTEAALGPKFDARAFNDFLLSQQPLPPDLMRQAVMQVFIPAQKKKKKK